MFQTRKREPRLSDLVDRSGQKPTTGRFKPASGSHAFQTAESGTSSDWSCNRKFQTRKREPRLSDFHGHISLPPRLTEFQTRKREPRLSDPPASKYPGSTRICFKPASGSHAFQTSPMKDSTYEEMWFQTRKREPRLSDSAQSAAHRVSGKPGFQTRKREPRLSDLLEESLHDRAVMFQTRKREPRLSDGSSVDVSK